MDRRGKNWMLIGIILAGFSVAIGAFGAHGLETRFKDLNPIDYVKKIENWKTAAMYQFFHALGIIVIGIVSSRGSQGREGWLNLAAMLMVLGILLFSGSLYLITLAGVRFGMIVPLGGSAFILGWIAFAVGVWRSNPQ